MGFCRLGLITILAAAAASFGTISDWVFDNSVSFESTDSLRYTYRSDRDTTVSRIYVETGDASSGLDTVQDALLYTIIIVDNGTLQLWGDKDGLLPDGDPTQGAFLFDPGESGLAPALYHVLLSDSDNAVSDTFRIAALSNPYRTVSGTVTPPTGETAQLLMVDLYPRDAHNKLSAFTNSAGEYEIALDQQTVEACSGQVQVQLIDGFVGYFAEPASWSLDIGDNSATGADFSFVSATSSIGGVVTANGTPLVGMRVRIADSTWNDAGSAWTDSLGAYTIYCRPGSYNLAVDVYDQNENYLRPSDTMVTVLDDQNLSVNLRVVAVDAFIYGRLTFDGAAPSGTYAMSAWSIDVGSNWVPTDPDGWFAVPVSSTAEVYSVGVQDWGDYDRLPEGYVLEGGDKSIEAVPGDTVILNMIPKPAGGIAGTFTNNSSFGAQVFFIRLMGTDTNGLFYQFQTRGEGAYTFDGVPDGIYTAEAGMSVVGEDEWHWKLQRSYAGLLGDAIPIMIEGGLVTGIDWVFTDADTTGGSSGPGPEGQNILEVTIDNQSSHQAGEYQVTLWQTLPSQMGPGTALQTFHLFDPTPGTPLKVPSGTVAVSGRFASAGDSTSPPVELEVMPRDGNGDPLWFTFSGTDTHSVTIVFTDADTVPAKPGPGPSGSGILAVTVLNASSHSADTCEIVMWNHVPTLEEPPLYSRRILVSNDPVVLDDVPESTLVVGVVMMLGQDSSGKMLALFTLASDSLGDPLQLSFTANDTINLALELTDADTVTMNVGPGPGPHGDGVVTCTIVNASSYEAAGFAVLLWEQQPGSSDSPPPVRYFPVDSAGTVTFTGIPAMNLLIAGEMRVVGDSGQPERMGFVLLGDSTGTPTWFDFTNGDSHTVTIEFRDEDIQIKGHNRPTGNGVVSGTVTYTGDLPADTVLAMLYWVDEDEVLDVIAVDSTGFYQFDRVPAGTFRIAAVIDTNGDYQPEAVGRNDSLLVFTDDEIYENIDVAIAALPSGEGSIAGVISFEGDVPANAKIVVFAVPIDTTVPDSQQLNDMAFMFSPKIELDSVGEYAIQGLADGVYYVLAIIEVDDSLSDSKDGAFGAYGTFVPDTTLDIPFDLTPIVVSAGGSVVGIDFAMVSEQSVGAGSGAVRVDAPAVFSLQVPGYSRASGVVTLRFGVPSPSRVTIRLLDLAGRSVGVLHDGFASAGYHTVQWNTRSSGHLSSGFYVCRMTAGRFSANLPLRIVR